MNNKKSNSIFIFSLTFLLRKFVHSNFLFIYFNSIQIFLMSPQRFHLMSKKSLGLWPPSCILSRSSRSLPSFLILSNVFLLLAFSIQSKFCIYVSFEQFGPWFLPPQNSSCFVRFHDSSIKFTSPSSFVKKDLSSLQNCPNPGSFFPFLFLLDPSKHFFLTILFLKILHAFKNSSMLCYCGNFTGFILLWADCWRIGTCPWVQFRSSW